MKLKLDNGKVLTVKLAKDYGGELDIVVTKVDGVSVGCGILLTLQTNGKFKRVDSINSTIGLELNDNSAMKEDK